MRRISRAKPGLTVSVKALPVSTASSSWLVDARLMALREFFNVNVNARRAVRYLGHRIETWVAKTIWALQQINFRRQPRALQ